jgi:ATP-binding cassette subfamily B protein
MFDSVGHLGSFFAYVIRGFRLAKWALFLTLVLLVLEYASLSLMMPLSASASPTTSTAPTGQFVTDFWHDAARRLGLAPELSTWLWLFLVLMALRTLAGYGHQLLTTYLSKQVHRTLSDNVFRRVLYEEAMTQIYRRSVGFYIMLAGDDTFRAGSLVNYALLVLGSAVSAAAGLVLLYLFSPPILHATLFFLGVSTLVIALTTRRMLRLNGEAVETSRELNTAFLEALNSLRSIRSMSSEGFVRASYAQQITRYTRQLFFIEAIKNGIRFVPGIIALVTGIVLLAPWSGTADMVSAGTAFGALTILLRVFTSLGALTTSGGAFLVDARAATDLGELIRFSPSAAPSVAAPKLDASLPGGVDLVEIEYAYDNGRKVLDKTAFRMEVGGCYAIIGPSGSGKSTLADVLLGMIDPQAGHVAIGDQVMTATSLRQRVVLVEQQPRIFSVSLRENLTLGLPVADEEVEAVLAVVDMVDYAHSLPQGLDSVFEYQGANLSGGQRQRLSIARALLRHPQILILDEATSALDSVTRDAVVSRLRQFMRQGVVLFITHDETIAQLADAVLELDMAPQDAQARSAASSFDT